MPKRIKQRWPDVNEVAHQLVFRDKQATKEPTAAELSRVMAALGRKGGKVGGKRRMETMTAEQRTKIASRAAKARWKKREL
jgi:phage gp16-like protein